MIVYRKAFLGLHLLFRYADRQDLGGRGQERSRTQICCISFWLEVLLWRSAVLLKH